MKIVFAADGSKHTKKALAYLVTYESLVSKDAELFVLNVQAVLPGPVKRALGSVDAAAFYAEEADKVLKPVQRFLDRHGLRHRCASVVGSPAAEIVRASQREKAHLVVMGTHGHGLIGRALMGSVAQRVVADSEVAVLLVK